LLPEGQLHTVFSSVYRRRLRARFAIDRIEHADGGHNELHWLLRDDAPGDGPVRDGSAAVPAPSGPLLVILHGLVGGSSERYVRFAAMTFARRFPTGGAVVFNARGCGGSELSSPQVFNGAHTADLRAAIASLHARNPARPIVAVGYSLGAGLLTKYVCEEGARCVLAAAVAVCPTFDLVASTKALESGFMPMRWNGVLVASLKKWLRRNLPALQRLGAPGAGGAAGGAGAVPAQAAAAAAAAAAMPPFPNLGPFAAPESPTSPRDALRRPVDVKAALAAQRCREFDHATVAAMFGYADAESYYADASTAHRLQHIGVPFLALLAEDDPICVASTIPRGVFARGTLGGAPIIAAVAREGGHVGFATAADWTGESWDNEAVCEFAAAVLEGAR